ncbi:alpha/beta-hydrolase [Fomitiporia mediterranea MF3/22]|uniref:alpha/beta-hydrolase n=1 Tax=Fomitiporia mediterranea (strain MF3/22) TaxID=694068 RepID=UPI0004409941|nr:alpha/beta-hydrolase [Fomitiporia mediterranea MF3/22]EJD03465.1 alpha/beta-hydrolase [Fomitiporia mediterranea MF3/22]
MGSTANSNRRTLTSSDGCQIYADAVGDSSKPCLVFIHGFTLSAAVWDNIFADPRYSSEFYLVRYDVRGHGRSGKPDTIEEYASKLFADDFAAVLQAFKVHKPIVVAWSLGATVVADIAAHLPADTLAGVVYISPCPYTGSIMQAIGTPFILNLLTDITGSDDANSVDDNMQVFFNSCFNDPESIPWETRALWQGMSTFQRPRHRRFALTRPQDPTGLKKLGAQGLPVLVMIGTRDTQIILSNLETEVRNMFSNVDFCVLEGAGHSPHFENTDEVMGRISGFTRKVFSKVVLKDYFLKGFMYLIQFLQLQYKKPSESVSRMRKGSGSVHVPPSQRPVHNIVV